MKTAITVESRDFIISLYDYNVVHFPYNIEELSEWFKDHGLSEVEEFLAWRCKIDGRDKYFSIKRGEGEIWNVLKLQNENEKNDFYKAYFSFKCVKGQDFVKLFESGLVRKIQETVYKIPRIKIFYNRSEVQKKLNSIT